MYLKTIFGIIIPNSYSVIKNANDVFPPSTQQSDRWKHWVTHIDVNTCYACSISHGKIFKIQEQIDTEPPLHKNCRCLIEIMKAVIAGNATNDGEKGADWWIKQYSNLPDYYIDKEALSRLGWKPGKSPADFAPGKMIYSGIYVNYNGHLPQTVGRVWYEEDINYYNGKRNRHRILYSNDGLIFVTYDHYSTFYEIA